MFSIGVHLADKLLLSLEDLSNLESGFDHIGPLTQNGKTKIVCIFSLASIDFLPKKLLPNDFPLPQNFPSTILGPAAHWIR